MRTQNYIDPAMQALSENLKLNMDWKTLESTDRFWDCLIHIKLGDKQLNIPVEIKPEIRNIHLSKIQKLKERDPNFLLVTKNITKPLRKKLRDLSINFIDGQGNASVHIADIHIAANGLQGQKAPEKVKTFRASSLKLIWYLLQKQESLNKSYREIASGSGVSLDTISKTLRALGKQNFYIPVKKGEYKLVNKKSLLEKWLISFEDTLKPKLYITRYRFADKKMSENWKNILLDSNRILWGGEPAAAKLTNYLVPEMFTIYIDLTEKELLKHYRLIPDKTGNIEVYQLFFNSIEFDCKDIVPPLLIYADLQSSGEERNMETAERIYEEYLADIIQ